MPVNGLDAWIRKEFEQVMDKDKVDWHFTPKHARATLCMQNQYLNKSFVQVTAYRNCRKIAFFILPWDMNKEDKARYLGFLYQFVPKEGKLTRESLEPFLNAYRTLVRMELMK